MRRTAIPAAIFAIAFVYQLSSPAFVNDHFEHLSKAQLVRQGEYPVLDFMDPGRPLMIAASAILLWLSDGALVGEALFTMGAIAAGVALVYVLALRLTTSIVFAMWAAACVLAIEPRLYNYPKVIACVVAAWFAFRYIERPAISVAAGIGVWTAVAFLFRHDLGVYVGVFLMVAVLLGQGTRNLRTAALHASLATLVAFVVVAPYLWFLATAGALTSTGGDGFAALAGAARLTARPFVFSTVSDGTPWIRYDAENWIYDLFLIAPAATVGVLLRRRRSISVTDRQALALAVLCFMLVLFLIRGNLDSRLADVAAPSFVLAAWLLTAVGGPLRQWPSRRGDRAGPALALSIAVVTALSVSALADRPPVRRLVAALVRLPGSITEPVRQLRGDPLDMWEREGTTDVRGLARWLRECTAPGDRALIFGYHPEVSFYSQRAFAGGMPFFHAGYFSKPAEQLVTVDRLRSQSVPFVVVESSYLPALENTYAIVGSFVLARYTRTAESAFGGKRTFVIYERAGSAPRTLRNGLPCMAGA